MFCPAKIQTNTSAYRTFCFVNAVIPPTLQNGAQGFTDAFPAICSVFAAVVRRLHTAILCRLCHVGAHHSTAKPPAHTRYHRHAGRCTGQRIPPIIIMYIRAQGCAPVMDPCQTVQHTTDHASPAVCDLAPVSSQGTPGQSGALYPAGQSSSWGAAGGAEPLTATAVSLFGLSPDS